jgi:hydrogenase maturation factor
MLGLIEGGRFIATGGVRPGDVVIQVGPVRIKGAAALAREAAHRLGSLDRAVVRAAIEALREPGISVVEPALLASDLEASSLHDPPRGSRRWTARDG